MLHGRKGPKKFECGFSPKTFTTFANVIKHEGIHTGEKPYACEQCGKRFAEKENLKSHQVTHIFPNIIKYLH